ncbi:MAG: hypothetical protein A2Z47_05860 [Thermodesulfovibrio sp. RBG_19FT_COMBO_42_12]|nr:MAG: hypothetical protein A2Z47_05860 [Thermodesulfovibrio sp. RBG_19FT_COMBO_42_12]HZX48540.1 hypothetical protein [Nitrospirota bacterium]
MRKYDKSLTEVWDWKEKVYEAVKDLSADKYIEKLKKDADKVLSDNYIKLTPVSLKKKHHKVA